MIKFLSAILLLLLFTGISFPIHAEKGPASYVQDRIEDRKQKIDEIKNANKEKKCEILNDNIDKLVQRYESNHQRRMDSYARIIENLRKVEERLIDLGYDVYIIESDFKILNNLIANYSQLHLSFVSTLKDTNNLECGSSEGEFKERVQQSQVILKQMREKSQEITEFYKNTVKPDLKALKNQKSDQ